MSEGPYARVIEWTMRQGRMAPAMPVNDRELARLAGQGDKEAARLLCGDYDLVMDPSGRFWRTKGEVPEGFTFVAKVYDQDGFLQEPYWVHPRIPSV